MATTTAYNQDGIIRPRIVARSLQLAKLLGVQDQQRQGAPHGGFVIPYQDHAYLLGGLLYFMIERINHCQGAEQCDPSKAALFHWFDDTLRRTFTPAIDNAELIKERGMVVNFLQTQAHDFAEASAVLREINPYQFTIYPVPEQDHLVTQTVMLLTKPEYLTWLHQLLTQYKESGMTIAASFLKYDQKPQLRYLLRGITTLRTLIRGFAEAALLNRDYVLAAESFIFSGDFFHADCRKLFEKIIEEIQNDYPETCETLRTLLQDNRQDWFQKLATFYQDATA